MNRKTFPSSVRFIHVSRTSIFRLEVQVLGKGHAPSADQCYDIEYVRNNQKWIMSVTHFKNNEYRINLRAPGLVPAFTYKKYQRTNDSDTLAISPWNFGCSEQMAKWDVILSVGESKFYAHKQTLSLVSPTFRSMLEGHSGEKGPQVVPVNIEGTNAEHFEAFLQCLYPCGSEPKGEFLVPLVTLADYFNVKPVLEKCVALAGSLSSEEVVTSLTKDDIRKVLASDLKDQLDGTRWEKLVAQSLSLNY